MGTLSRSEELEHKRVAARRERGIFGAGYGDVARERCRSSYGESLGKSGVGVGVGKRGIERVCVGFKGV